MADSNSITNDFLHKITGVIEAHLSNEQFGVSELANEIGMSRSNLLRKIKKATNLSASQFIRQIRLKNAMEMLRENDITVSEVSYEVGFGSTSYFVKCFHDHYGYPPGEVAKRELPEGDSIKVDQLAAEPIPEQNKIVRFLEELKRRKVGKVIIIYASVTFILLQLLSVLIEPLYLPQWTMTFVIVLLAIGFPIAVLFSWIFDITPTGIEVTQSLDKEGNVKQGRTDRKKGILFTVIIGVLLILVAVLAYPKIVDSSDQTEMNPDLEKSIAVLPFKNDSEDASNVYIINGLMEATLTNLQNIKDLRVISRTSVEKYRTAPKTIPEISKELNVNYLVEGSGQKIGDKILLNIQLIDGTTDKHLWAEQYQRDASDIFELQQEVAKKIAGKIEAIITPEEVARINKIPTENLEAYDYFLRGQDLFLQESREGLFEAIPYFEKAIEHDNTFSLAYGNIAISYYYLDLLQADKIYAEQIKANAAKALEYDSIAAQSLLAKAMYHMHVGEHKMAVPYLEKALKYNPNSAWVLNFLSDFYTNYIPDTKKYLEYALQGIVLNVGTKDSVAASYSYLHLSNAFLQTGFIKEAEMYINKSLSYNPENLFSAYVKAYVLLAKNKDLANTKALLLQAYQKDESRMDILQEIGKICYYMRNYKEAYTYYSKFMEVKETHNLDIFLSENMKIAFVFAANGKKTKADEYMREYKTYVDNDLSIYRDLNLAMYQLYGGNTTKAIENLRLFSKQDNYFLWITMFLEIDPLVDPIKDNPEFQQLLEALEAKFWNNHNEIKVSLEEKKLL